MNFDLNNIPYSKYRIVFHILFWVVAVLGYALAYGAYNNQFLIELKINLMALPIKMAATYSTIYLLMPWLFFKRRYLLFVVFFILSALLFSSIEWVTLYTFAFSVFYPDTYNSWNYSFIHQNLIGIIHIYPIVIVAASVKIIQHWIKNLERTNQLENEKLEAELKFLKAQIHPHFLFNTLNNLYALTLKKSDEAPEVVLKLSGLLDYMLYEGSSKMVRLDHELKHLKNYIELERLRYGKKLNYSEHISGLINGKHIAPLILLPFVENSFKHGASSGIKLPQIFMSINVTDSILTMEVSNTTLKQTDVHKDNSTSGIGLSNVRRRLELLYAGRYSLIIKDDDARYTVYLTIDIEEQ